MLTHKDLCERLKLLEETILVEVLDIDSEMIVDRFEDVVEERYDYLVEELDELLDGEENDPYE